jgi:hypothetical protein
MLEFKSATCPLAIRCIKVSFRERDGKASGFFHQPFENVSLARVKSECFMSVHHEAVSPMSVDVLEQGQSLAGPLHEFTMMLSRPEV